MLDLCSSWVSHLPREVEYEKVWGHGMNATELGRNERLDGFFVRDFNETPKIDAKDCSFDAVTMCVSVQYLQRPEEVFAEIFRVLNRAVCASSRFRIDCFIAKPCKRGETRAVTRERSS